MFSSFCPGRTVSSSLRACDEPCWAITFWSSFLHGARGRSRFMDGHHGHPGHHGHRSARSRVVACLLVKHHQPSLAPAPTLVRQHHRPGLAPAPPRSPIGNPALVSPYVERFSLWYWSAFGAWKVRDDGCLLVWFWSACSSGFGLLAFRLVFIWLTFGYRLVSVGLVLVLLVLACLLPFGSLVVRLSGPVLDSVDDVLDAWFAWFACLVCLLGSFG
jgi:hypothetical protein